MIDRGNVLPVTRQASLLRLSRSSVYYLPRPVPPERLAIMAASCAFAGPLLHLLGEAGGGVHLFGQSRRGKSTALHVAASVWGAPRGHTPFARSWRATGNALEATAAEHNDTLLPLDEIGQVEPRELGEVAYMLANGVGKGRAHREGRAKPALTWRMLFLSTGEKRMAGSCRAQSYDGSSRRPDSPLIVRAGR